MDGAIRSVTDGSTFPPGLPRSVGTSHVLLHFDQVLLRLSNSVKVVYNEPQYDHGIKMEVHLDGAINKL